MLINNSENAVSTQVWIATTTYLLMIIVEKRAVNIGGQFTAYQRGQFECNIQSEQNTMFN